MDWLNPRPTIDGPTRFRVPITEAMARDDYCWREQADINCWRQAPQYREAFQREQLHNAQAINYVRGDVRDY